MESIFFKKIIWAIDPLEPRADYSHPLFLLGALARTTGAKIEPVYVLNAAAEVGSELGELAKKKISQLTGKFEEATMGEGKLLVAGSKSTRRVVRTLLDYASEEECDAIVVATHARQGLPRFYLGSFAETLALMSPLPIFTVNPDTIVRERISKILFPTNFYPRYKATFGRVIELAKVLEASITLFHKQLPDETVDSKTLAREWQAMAQQYRVETDVHIHAGTEEYSVACCDYAKDHSYDLVAMASQSDQVSALLMGSSTRAVIRHAPCPVWVMNIDKSDDFEKDGAYD